MKKKLLLTTVLASAFLGAHVSADSVTRLYDKVSGNHWFTTDPGKVTSLANEGWANEGTAFDAPDTGDAVYVITSPTGYYHFTSNKQEIAGLVAKGWTQGAPVFNSVTSGGVPVYRVYNPNTGRHHFTASTKEVSNLTAQGWQDEGVAYQVSSAPVEETPAAATGSSASEGQLASVLNEAFKLLGTTTGSDAHRQIVDEYNSVNPKPVGYTVTYDDDWCDVFVTVVFQRAGLSDLIGRECGVERHIQIMKQKGIWDENDNKTPKVGDIITYNWDSFDDDNVGFADHIGIVYKVENGIIYTIEGNTTTEDNGTRRVEVKSVAVGQGQIRGFASPRYAS